VLDIHVIYFGETLQRLATITAAGTDYDHTLARPT
jgi:hypothetical protein